MFPINPILPLYKLFDSGMSSPETMYSMAPAAIDKQILIIPSDICPTSAPKNAPTPVVTPDSIVYIRALILLIPPFFIGTDIEIPSGIS